MMSRVQRTQKILLQAALTDTLNAIVSKKISLPLLLFSKGGIFYAILGSYSAFVQFDNEKVFESLFIALLRPFSSIFQKNISLFQIIFKSFKTVIINRFNY